MARHRDGARVDARATAGRHSPAADADASRAAGPGTTALPPVAPATGPADRNRYVDLIRLVAILVVVLGHWLDIIIVVEGGKPSGVSALEVVGFMRWLSLLLQVMPMFFLAGGFAAAASWPSWQARGGQWPGWTRARLVRLLRPTTWFVALMSMAAAAALALGADPTVVAQAGWGVALQLWFLPVYMLLIVLAVPMTAAWRRGGWLVLAAAVVLVGVVDLLVRLDHGGVARWASYLLVPGAGFLLGIAWRAGALAPRAVPLALLVGGSMSLLVLVGALGYPPWMVGVPGEPMSNTSPPNLALVAYAAAQVGLVLLLEPPMRRWLRRRRVWAAVARGNAVIMTLYLWHLVPVVVLAALMVGLDLPTGPPAGTLSWWLARPVWMGTLAVILAALVAVMGRFERPRPAPIGVSGSGAAALVVACAVLTGYALSRLALGGFAPQGRLAVVPVGLYAVGMAALWLAGRGVDPVRTAARHRAGEVSPQG